MAGRDLSSVRSGSAMRFEIAGQGSEDSRLLGLGGSRQGARMLKGPRCKEVTDHLYFLSVCLLCAIWHHGAFVSVRSSMTVFARACVVTSATVRARTVHEIGDPRPVAASGSP